MPEPGRVYWSARAQRYYQEGRRGAVSRDQAIGRLSYDPDLDRFRDQRGRLVPQQGIEQVSRKITAVQGVDQQGRPFIRSEFYTRTLSKQGASDAALAGNQQTQVRVVVRTGDGRVHVFYATSKLGTRADIEKLETQAKKNAAGRLRDEGYKIDTGQVANQTVSVSYSVRTVRTRSAL